MKLNDLYFESLISLIFVFVAGCASSRVVKRVYDFEEGTMPNWTQVLPIASDTLEGPAHTFENGLLNMKTHAKHATLMVYNQQDIKDCGIEAKIMWRTFSTRYADVPKYSSVWVRLSEKGGYLFGIEKKSNIFAEGAAFGSYKVNPGKDDEFTEDSFMLKEFHVELKRWYHLKMAARGSHFTFYLDGEKVGETENDLFEKGQLAVYTVSSAEPSFDDVIITYLVDDK